MRCSVTEREIVRGVAERAVGRSGVLRPWRQPKPNAGFGLGFRTRSENVTLLSRAGNSFETVMFATGQIRAIPNIVRYDEQLCEDWSGVAHVYRRSAMLIQPGLQSEAAVRV